MPGLIDPHLHPTMAAVLLPMQFVTAMEWKLPWTTVAPVETPEAFVARVRALHQQMPDPQEPLLVWGYHQLWHGDMNQALLNDIAMTRPVIVWHRSFHELVMNDAALEWLNISEAEAGNRHQIDYNRGRFYENGLSYAISRLNPYLLEPKRYREGLRRLAEVVHFGGHTTICDMATGLFDFDESGKRYKMLSSTRTRPSASNWCLTPGACVEHMAGMKAPWRLFVPCPSATPTVCVLVIM